MKFIFYLFTSIFILENNSFIFQQNLKFVLQKNKNILCDHLYENTFFSKIPDYNYNHLDPQNFEKMKKILYNQNRNYSPYRKQPYGKPNNTEKLNITNLNEYKKKMEYLNNEIVKNIENQKNNKYTFEEDFGEHFFYPKNNRKLEDGYFDDNGVFRYKPKYEQSKKNIDIQNKEDNKRNPNENTDEFSSENNFQVVKQTDYTFKNIGGYENIKNELMQISDILVNYEKYKKYNVRTPKGLILNGPPGNGKTLIAKCFSGELNISFIQCSGAEFSEKYVGVGASRIRELFKLAIKNKPCVIFIDEIDALARKRGNDMVNSNSEKDQTLNQLLVNMDGFKDMTGIFVIGATNRVDMLDEAILRPGRMDKHIYIGNPDKKTRIEILKIHLKGKPIEKNIDIEFLNEMSSGFSGSQIENLLNESMLKALRENRGKINMDDLEHTTNRIISGFQSSENKYSAEMINRIITHEMGHAVVGFFSKEHSKLSKVCINLWSPKTPGYTIFENNDEDNNIHTKEGLFAHLVVLFSGRVAEEFFYGNSITTGAKHDLEQAYNLANDMILKYGMGKQNVYPYLSDKYKNIIDEEINELLLLASVESRKIIENTKELILDCCEMLRRENKLFPEQIVEIIDAKYPYLWDIYDVQKMYY